MKRFLSSPRKRGSKSLSAWIPAFAGMTIFLMAACLHAEEAVPVHEFTGTVTGVPMQYAFVEGDRHKFRELNWTEEGYDGGIEHFELKEKYLPEDLTAEVDGHAFIKNNDFEVNALLEKKDLGYVKLSYDEFSKYYDDSGGVYYPFNVLSPHSLGRELELQIGELRIETGLTVEDMPRLSFAYERHFKQGKKSRLTWTPVTVGSITRGIGPSFQDVDEVVNVIELNESHTLRGFELKGQQTWEWSAAELIREEQSLTNTSTAANAKNRVQVQEPQYHLFTTTESVERWYRDETVFTGMAYNFLRLRNNELEDIFEMNQAGAIINFSNPKQVRNARAQNEYDSHTWAGNVMFQPLSWLNVTTKARTELADRSGNSSYPQDTTPAAAGGAVPDNIINNTELSRTEDKVARIGEGLSIRITGIPRTALYNEFEFEQLRNWLSEDRDSQAGQSAPNAGEIFGRETIAYMSRGIWTAGAQVYPVSWLSWTGHLRLNRSNTDYDDKRETQPGATAARSAFMDAMNITAQELATKFTFKPRPWFKPSFRYQLRRTQYDTRVEDLQNVETSMHSHTFTFDVTLQPRHNLLILAGVSPQYAWVETPARYYENGIQPIFKSNVLTWLMNVTYQIHENLSFISGFDYSHANNFNDFTAIGLPMGAAFHNLNVSAGLDWKLSETVSILTEYAFLRYDPYGVVDNSDTSGHLISAKTRVNWG
jgi:hypothetical protein